MVLLNVCESESGRGGRRAAPHRSQAESFGCSSQTPRSHWGAAERAGHYHRRAGRAGNQGASIIFPSGRQRGSRRHGTADRAAAECLQRFRGADHLGLSGARGFRPRTGRTAPVAGFGKSPAVACAARADVAAGSLGEAPPLVARLPSVFAPAAPPAPPVAVAMNSPSPRQRWTRQGVTPNASGGCGGRRRPPAGGYPVLAEIPPRCERLMQIKSPRRPAEAGFVVPAPAPPVQWCARASGNSPKARPESATAAPSGRQRLLPEGNVPASPARRWSPEG